MPTAKDANIQDANTEQARRVGAATGRPQAVKRGETKEERTRRNDARKHRGLDMFAEAEAQHGPTIAQTTNIPAAPGTNNPRKKRPTPIYGLYGEILYDGSFKPSAELVEKEDKRYKAQNQTGTEYDRKVRLMEDALCRKWGITRPEFIPNTMGNGKITDGEHTLVVGLTVNDPQHKKMWGISQLDRTFHSWIAGKTGSGKSLPWLTFVLAKDGWKHIGDLELGEEIYTRSGKLAKVDGIYPQGKLPIWEIEFEDGTIIECGANHQWIDVRRSHGKFVDFVRTTEQMFDEGIRIKKSSQKQGNGYKHHIPMPKPIEFPEKILPIDPYVLGCFIGDGYIPRENSTALPSMSSADDELIARMEYKLDHNYKFIRRKNSYTWRMSVTDKGQTNLEEGNIDHLGLCFKYLNLRKHSYDKFIPDVYKFSSIEQRRELVRGLMDTDGSASKGRFRFTTISKQLADDLTEVLRSLGHIVYRSVDDRGLEKYPNSDGKAYSLHISGNDPTELFSLQRKIDDYGEYESRKSQTATLSNERREPIIFEDAVHDDELLLPPYLVGVLCRGSVGSTTGVWSSNTTEAMREHIIGMFEGGASWHIARQGHNTTATTWAFDVDGGTQRNGKHMNLALAACKQLGLACKSKERLIPLEYLHSGYAARQELLQGVLDAYGKFSGQTVEVYLNDGIMEQVRELAESLGYSAKVRRLPSGICYVQIRLADAEMFFDPKKRETAEGLLGRCLSTTRREYDNMLAIVDIRKTDRVEEQVCISVDDPTHSYILEGYIVTHNSTFIRSLLVQDMWYNRGGLLLEPHGDLSLELLQETPPYRLHNVIYIDALGDKEWSPGFNPLQVPYNATKDQRAAAVSSVVSLMAKHFSMDTGAVRLKKNLEDALNALVWAPGATLLEIMDFYTNENVRKTVLACMPDGADKERIADAAANVKMADLGSLDNRISAFANNMNMKRMFGQSKSTLDFYSLMNQGYMIIFPLNKGVSTDDSFRNFVGAYVISSIYHDSMKRANIPDKERVIFPLTIDEFQNYAGDDVAGMLSECRKYGLPLMLAHQYLGQLSGTIRTAVEQCGTKIYLQLTDSDARTIASGMPNVDAIELMNIPKFHAVVQTIRDSQTTEPFMSNNLNLAGVEGMLRDLPNAKTVADLVIDISHQKFMKKAEDIDAEIELRHNMLSDGATRQELYQAFQA